MRLLATLPLLMWLVSLVTAVAEIGPYGDVTVRRTNRRQPTSDVEESARSSDVGGPITVHTVHRNADFTTSPGIQSHDEDERQSGLIGESNQVGGDNRQDVQNNMRDGLEENNRNRSTNFNTRRSGNQRNRISQYEFGPNRRNPNAYMGASNSNFQSRNRVIVSGDRGSDGVNHRQRLDGLSTQLQRLGDRLLSMDNALTRRGERMDTVQYRLTKLEASGEERMSAINELSAAVRHRLQTSDFELEKIRDAIDGVVDSMVKIEAQNTRIQAFLEAQQAVGQANQQESSGGGPRLKAVMTAIHGLRSSNQGISARLDAMATNLTAIGDISATVSLLSDSVATKAYLRTSLAERSSQHQTPLMIMPQSLASSMPVATSPIDCYAVQQESTSQVPSGVYLIQPRRAVRPFFAYCDMTTDGGGWTVLQRRQDGSVDFLREWTDYKYGFGNLAGEFWLGNDNMHLLTNQHVVELRIDLHDFNQESAVARYSAFATGAEEEGYSLKLLGHYQGDAGDSLSYHVGHRWSTIDADSDAWPDQNCARNHKGAWWYRSCDTSNLNGQYLHGPVPHDHEYTGVYWYDYRGPLYSLWKTTMMIRRGGSVQEPVIVATTTTTPSPPSTEGGGVEGAEGGPTATPGGERTREGDARERRQRLREEGAINTGHDRSTSLGRRRVAGRGFDPDRDPVIVYDQNDFYD